MAHIWLSAILIIIGLIASLLSVFKHAFLPKKTPLWFFYIMAIVLIIGAGIQIYQDIRSRQWDKGVAGLAAGITPQSDPKPLTPEQQKLWLSLRTKISRVEPGKSKLFVAPDVSSKTFYELGLIAFNQRDFVQAEEYLNAALKADKNNISAFNLLLQLYQSAAMNHLQDREMEAAELCLKKATQLMDYLPPAINLETVTMVGYLYKSVGQVYEISDPSLSEEYWEKAEKIFEKVLTSKEKDPGALNGMGNVLSHKRRFEEALKKHVQALEALPNYAGAAHDAAGVCEDLMEQDPSRKEVWKTKAIGFWERAVELSKDDPQFAPEYASKIRARILRLSSEDP